MERYSELNALLKQLQQRDLSMHAPMASIHVVSASFSETIPRNFTELLTINEGFAAIMENRVQSWTPAETKLVVQKCPVPSADVKRSFSTYKLVLTDNRKRFTEDNLSVMLFLASNRD